MNAPETAAATLRRAAEKLRGLANAATGGPWGTHSHHRRREVHSGSDTWLADFGNDVSGQARADAEYVAALHPGVALLIADLWDVIANDMSGDEVVERGKAGIGVLVVGRIFAPRKSWTAAVAAARAFLGEEASR